jgi:hypothetical protein
MDALRKMATVLALAAGTTVLGAGCVANGEDPATSDETQAVTEDKATTDATAAADEKTGEGRQAWWGWGGFWNPWFRPWWGGFGWGWPAYGWGGLGWGGLGWGGFYNPWWGGWGGWW